MAAKFDLGNFEQEVLKSDVPVLVDFYADWCGPCKMMGPVVETLAEDYAGKVKVGKVNVDENTELALRYGVQSIPSFKVFKNGQIVGDALGAVGQEKLESLLDAAL